MAWFGDSLSSLSSLKGQITNFTKEVKEVLSDGIVEEIDERSKALNEANERCSQLQDLLNTRDAEISLLRRQNCELQRAVIEINAKSKELRDTNHTDETEGVFWDPSCVDNRNARNHVRQLQEQLAQATVKVRELECELKRVQKVNNASLQDDITDGHQKAEVVRAKQDMMNRIIQMEEKTREAERNAKHIQLDEASLIHDFRSVISKLNSREKFDLVSGALKALQIESETHEKIKNHEKSNEGLEKVSECNRVRHHSDTSSQQNKPNDTAEEIIRPINREEILQKRIEVLQNENKDLLDAMEKLDEEHTQSIEKLLSLREETNKKHRYLQGAYEQLSVDYNEVQKRIIELQTNESKYVGNASAEMNYQSVQTDDVEKLEKYAQVIVPSQEDDVVSEASNLNDITQKVKMILKNHTISSVEPGESIFEAIAKQCVDTRWKLDVLERKVTEIARDLKESEEVRDSLQIECDELQSHIDSLLLENQTLKSSLPSIPEASEERVAFLETETESLQEEVKRLLAENETMQKTNSTLSAVQGKEVSLANHDHLQEGINFRVSAEEKRELPVILERNENEDIDRVSVELDRENITEELQLSVSKIKLLETNLASLQATVAKLSEENKDLSQRNKHLDMQCCDLREENSYLLANDLQKQLNIANREKFDLENDILRKEEELDAIRIEIDKLNQDNDTLIKDNVTMAKQLNATNDESLDKIEFLNTEMSLLQQEHEDVIQEMSICKDELTQTKEKLIQAQERYVKLENEYCALNAQCEQFQAEKQDIQSEERRAKELENNPSVKESLRGESNMLQNLFNVELLGQKIGMFQAKETVALLKKQLSGFQDVANVDKINDKEEEEVSTAKDDLVGNIVRHTEAEKQDSVEKGVSVTLNDNERQALEAIIDEERREKDAMKICNENLREEIMQLQCELRSAVENNKESTEMAKRTIEDLSHYIRGKDEEVSVLQAEIMRASSVISQLSSELATIKSQKDEFEQLVSVKHNESLQCQNEIQKLILHVNEQAAHIQGLIAEQAASEMRDKANIEELHLKSMQKSYNEADQIADNSRQSAEIAALNKKCDALEAALIQEQSNYRILQNQLTESQNKEANSAKELERLRTHLVEMESSYTEEALIAEKTRDELEAKLLQAEEKVKSSSTAFTSANVRANQQVETLQQQIALITQQRDHIQAKLSAAEDNILLQSASLTNLQIVLEQFQQDKERDVLSATEKIRIQLNESYKKQDEHLNDISILKQQLSEAKECLQAASRLSEQLEKKDAQIERLNEEVARLTASLDFADQRVKEAAEHDEGKVDKILIKNLLLGYLSSTTSDKSSILRVFANVLDFTESEKDKTGLNAGGRLLRSNDSGAPSKEASLSMAFVRFLESESKPKPQLPALPIVNSSSPRPGHNKQQSQSSSAQSTLSLSNVALPTFPEFIPARNTGSILKEVLKDS